LRSLTSDTGNLLGCQPALRAETPFEKRDQVAHPVIGQPVVVPVATLLAHQDAGLDERREVLRGVALGGGQVVGELLGEALATQHMADGHEPPRVSQALEDRRHPGGLVLFLPKRVAHLPYI
jgi:hypothetical protein